MQAELPPAVVFTCVAIAVSLNAEGYKGRQDMEAHLLNSELYDHSPEVVAAFRARGDEIVGHGRTNTEHQNDFDEAGEVALIREANPMGTVGKLVQKLSHHPH